MTSKEFSKLFVHPYGQEITTALSSSWSKGPFDGSASKVLLRLALKETRARSGAQPYAFPRYK
jgi:hypothetical protein